MCYRTQAYKTIVFWYFCGSYFNFLCMTLFACSEEYRTTSTRKTVVILHSLMLVFISGTSTQENNFFPFQSFMLINLSFLISSLINSCSNLLYALNFYLDTYFQTGYLDCSTAEQRDCTTLCELELYYFIFFSVNSDIPN